MSTETTDTTPPSESTAAECAGQPQNEHVHGESAGSESHAETPDNGMAQMQADLERFRDLALRSQADFENYRKRSNREKEDAVRYANFSLVEKMVPVMDSFELGLAAARGHEAAEAIVSGMEMVRRQFEDVLRQFGVEAIESAGLPFDPNLHEAVAQEPSNEVPEGAVVRQLRKGYKLKDRLVRAALVVVSGGPSS